MTIRGLINANNDFKISIVITSPGLDKSALEDIILLINYTIS